MFTHTKRRVGAVLGSIALMAGFATAPTQSSAQDMYLGQIFMTGTSWCPRGSARLDGQLLAINNNSALFSLLGTTFGGDGRTSFGLPDLRGRSPMHNGSGPGLSQATLGAKGGASTHTMTIAEMPAHSHDFNTSQQAADKNRPNSDFLAASPTAMYHDGPPDGKLDAGAVGTVGGGQAFNIQDPFLVINYCIATTGVYPSRS